MHEFTTFAYLDLEKTGTTFVSRMLSQFAREECIYKHHHRPAPADYDPRKFYFISVRNPLDSYLSLYSFGCQGKGKVYNHFDKKGLDHLYDSTLDGFSEWLRHVIKPKNAISLGDGYHRVANGRIAKLMGFQSFRFLRLAIPDPETLLDDVRTPEDIRAVYEKHKLPNFTVRHETFVDDLCTLVSGPLAHAFPDQAETLDYIRHTEPVNASERVDALEKFEIPPGLKARLAGREWLAAEVLGYGIDDYNPDGAGEED